MKITLHAAMLLSLMALTAGTAAAQGTAELEKLVNQTENWKQIVGGFQAAEQAVEDQAETLEQLPLGDFMRV